MERLAEGETRVPVPRLVSELLRVGNGGAGRSLGPETNHWPISSLTRSVVNSVRGAGLLVNLRAWCHQWLWMTRLVSTRCGRRRIPTARHAATSVVYQCSYMYLLQAPTSMPSSLIFTLNGTIIAAPHALRRPQAGDQLYSRRRLNAPAEKPVLKSVPLLPLQRPQLVIIFIGCSISQ